jgi:hypothetical protein
MSAVWLMKSFLKVFVVAILGVVATGAAADSLACKECGPQVQDGAKQDSVNSHRDQLRADRAKYDRENEKVVARPWDLTKGDKLVPEKNK